ncbi:helix-turn-helix domain-containing protein [Kineosporia babensis]|uniref:helix-turn-helix domain-containing protein n=1 Tax=Kineosporia babensis TaxID=499548 RepID=UPI0038B3B4AD
MRVATVRDVGVLARRFRREQGLTQADLAERVGVGREWIVRLESGHPRLEAQKVLDTLFVLGLVLDVGQPSLAAEAGGQSGAPRTPRTDREATASAVHPLRSPKEDALDPFEALFSRRAR